MFTYPFFIRPAVEMLHGVIGAACYCASSILDEGWHLPVLMQIFGLLFGCESERELIIFRVFQMIKFEDRTELVHDSEYLTTSEVQKSNITR